MTYVFFYMYSFCIQSQQLDLQLRLAILFHILNISIGLSLRKTVLNHTVKGLHSFRNPIL